MRTLAALTVFLLVAACGSEPGSDGSDPATAAPASGKPEDAVEKLLTALEAGSCSGVKDVVLTPATVDCEMVGTMAGSLADEGVALGDITYVVDEIVADSGSVTTGTGSDDETSTWQVERVDGAWKVIFDSVE